MRLALQLPVPELQLRQLFHSKLEEKPTGTHAGNRVSWGGRAVGGGSISGLRKGEAAQATQGQKENESAQSRPREQGDLLPEAQKPQKEREKPGMLIHTYNPSIWETGTGGLGVQSPLGYIARPPIFK